MLIKINFWLLHLSLESQTPESTLKQNLEDLLDGYDFGFKRPERLDVKKPGPPFDPLISTESKKGNHTSYLLQKSIKLLASY